MPAPGRAIERRRSEVECSQLSFTDIIAGIVGAAQTLVVA